VAAHGVVVEAVTAAGDPVDIVAFGEKAMSFGSRFAENPNETEPSLFIVIFEKITSLIRPSEANEAEATESALKPLDTPDPSTFTTPAASTETWSTVKRTVAGSNVFNASKKPESAM
jgi:hypothetical protein